MKRRNILVTIIEGVDAIAEAVQSANRSVTTTVAEQREILGKLLPLIMDWRELSAWVRRRNKPLSERQVDLLTAVGSEINQVAEDFLRAGLTEGHVTRLTKSLEAFYATIGGKEAIKPESSETQQAAGDVPSASVTVVHLRKPKIVHVKKTSRRKTARPKGKKTRSRL